MVHCHNHVTMVNGLGSKAEASQWLNRAANEGLAVWMGFSKTDYLTLCLPQAVLLSQETILQKDFVVPGRINGLVH